MAFQLCLPPKPFKPCRISRRIYHSMPNIAMAEIVLNEPRVRALVGQGETASVPELVRVGRQFQPGQVAVFSDHKPGGAPVQGLSLLAYKKRAAGRLQPRALCGPRLDKPEFLRVQGMRRGATCRTRSSTSTRGSSNEQASETSRPPRPAGRSETSGIADSDRGRRAGRPLPH